MLARLDSVRILRFTILIVCLSILLPGLALAKGNDGEGSLPLGPERTANGGAPCYGSPAGVGIPGIKEMDGCINVPGATDCEGSTTSCWNISACGNFGERACCSGDGAPPACFSPQVEYDAVDPDSFGLCDGTSLGGCLCFGNDAGNTSNSFCQLASDCGGNGERACCPGEPGRLEIGDPACDAGLVEQLGCFGLDCGCSSSTCKLPTACGGDGQRGCCPGEPDRPTLGDFACPNAINGQILREVSAETNPLLFCGLNPDILSDSVCEAVEPCGGAGQRSCCLTEERLETGACQAGLTEAPGLDGPLSSRICGGTAQSISVENPQSLGTCVQVSSCGGIGERGCCLGAERLDTVTGACQAGLTEVPNGCTGNCYCGTDSSTLIPGELSSSTCISEDPPYFPIEEPSTNCTPGSPGCPLRGYADMHVHMFGHLAHGGAAFVGQPFDAEGGVNAALRQDAWTPAEMEYAGAPRAVIDKYGDPVDALDEGQCIDMAALSFEVLTWTDGECQDSAGNRVVEWHGVHGPLYDTIGAGTYDMAGNVDLSNIDTPAGPLGTNAPFGAPAFNAWPTWTTTVHQQVYYKWLERAYIGGLRLMVMMAVNSEAACRTGNHLADIDCEMSMLPPDRLDELDRYDERFKLLPGQEPVLLPPIELQLQAAYEFEDWLNQQPGGGWFKIVRTPEESRQAIAEGKLAVVLSIEVDHLFNCHATNSGPDYPNGAPREPCDEDDVLNGINKYYDKGVRHIFPVHNFDNAFAGAATWIGSLNIANRAMEGHWWEVEECPQGFASLDPPGDDGYGLKVGLGLFESALLALGFPEFDFICEDVIDLVAACAVDPDCEVDDLPPDPFGCTSLIAEQGPIYENNGFDTSCNQRGLTPDPIICPAEGEGEECDPRRAMRAGLGPFLIEALMDKGMLIDIDHMSIRSLNETLDRAEIRDYPLLASHGQFFELQKKFYDDPEETGDPEEKVGRHERLRTREQLERLGNLGSLVAVMLKDDAQPDFMRTKQTLPYLSTTGMPEITNDCRHSTKSWAQAYQYAVDVLDGPVAVGSDWNGVAQHLGPRFGNQGCGGSATVSIGLFDPDDGGPGETRAEERSAQEKTGDQLEYPFTIPGFGTFEKQITGQKTFDFNYDGLAHIGMMPDMLGDLIQIGLREEDLNPLMRSAEAYVTLWEKADFIAGSSDDLGPAAPAECVNRSVPLGARCSAVDVSIAVDSLVGNPDVLLTQSPAGPYAEGTRLVTLTVDRDNGLTCEAPDTCTATVTVSACVLTADTGGPYSTPEGQPVTLDGSNSFGPLGGSLTYAWDLDGDGAFDDATGVTTSFTGVADDGVFPIGLEVRNEAGETASDTSTVTVTNVAPSGLTFSATPIDENGITTLTGSFSDPGTLDTFDLDIDWGDSLSPGNTQTVNLGTNRTFSVNHQYLDDNPTATPSDNYTFSVMVTDDDGGSTSDTGSVTVKNLNPVVAAPVTSQEPSDEGSSVTASATFTDAGSLDTHQCTVNYGDGSGVQAATVLNGVCTGPAHIYVDNGTYTVTVAVTDDDTGVGSNSSSHQVDNVIPVVALPVTSPEPSDEGSAVTASATFTDVGTQDTHQCAIDYGDGSGDLPATVLNGVCTGPTHIYADNGTYTVTVKVTDDDGGLGSNSSSHQVDNVAPVVAVPVTSPEPSDEGSEVTASATFTDVGLLDTHQCTIDYGDGSGDLAATVLNGVCSGAHTYADNGTYTVTVKVTDDDGGMGSNSSSHQVDNVAPVVAVPATSPEPSDEGSSVTASATFTDVGILDTHQCTVDYGDGSGDEAATVLNGVCTGPTHIYVDNGSYTVTVKVTDNDGGMDSNSSSHQVDNVAPVVAGPVTSPEPSDEGSAVTASATFTDVGILDTHQCTVDYGDGSGDEAATVLNGVCTGPTHTYLDNGSYPVTIKVTDNDGGVGSNSSSHQVDNVAPVVAVPASSPEPSDEGSAVTASATFTDVGILDTHQCTVNYGEGSGDQAATVLNGVCTGPAHTYADNGSYTVTVIVTDNDGGVGSNSSLHQVDNVAPMFTSSSNSAEFCSDTPTDGTVEVSAEFTDPGFDWPLNGTMESFTATIDWGDGTVESAQVDSVTGSVGTPSTGLVSGSHVYVSGGIFTVTVTVQDDDGGSDSTTVETLINGASFNGEEISVVGTDTVDWINFVYNLRRIEVTAHFRVERDKPGLESTRFAVPLGEVRSIRVMTCEGDDEIFVDKRIRALAVLDGGDDNDNIEAGNGVSLLEGGKGDDTLFGGNGGNTINGGEGNDELTGGSKDDIMSGGDGDDILSGLRGDDFVDGGADTDWCVPGLGDDTVVNCEPYPPKDP